jgi:hypothetical protein
VDYDPASVIDHYIGMLELDLRTTRDQLSGSFFKSAHGKNGKIFRNVPMGKNLLKKLATNLQKSWFCLNLTPLLGIAGDEVAVPMPVMPE